MSTDEPRADQPGTRERLEAERESLEAEIAALRTELASARAKLDNEAALVRAANDQLEKNKQLLNRARAALASVVDPAEESGDP